MQLIGTKTAIVYLCAALAGGLLLHTSQKVQHAESELRALEANLAREEETMRVLTAEWEFLNSPPRLEALVREYLELSAPQSEKILTSTGDLPKVQPAIENIAPKKAPEPTVTNVSYKPVAQPAPAPVAVPKANPIKPVPAKRRSFDDLMQDLGQDPAGGGQ